MAYKLRPLVAVGCPVISEGTAVFFSRETQEFPMTYGRRRGQATSGDFFSFILLLFNMFLPF